MKKYLVTFMAPAHVMEAWAKTDAKEREEATAKMMTDWQTWIAAHSASIVDQMYAVGKTKKITASGIIDSKNDTMLYCVLQAESHEEAANMCEHHPHFGIPEATVEVMELRALNEMPN